LAAADSIDTDVDVEGGAGGLGALAWLTAAKGEEEGARIADEFAAMLDAIAARPADQHKHNHESRGRGGDGDGDGGDGIGFHRGGGGGVGVSVPLASPPCSAQTESWSQTRYAAARRDPHIHEEGEEEEAEEEDAEEDAEEEEARRRRTTTTSAVISASTPFEPWSPVDAAAVRAARAAAGRAEAAANAVLGEERRTRAAMTSAVSARLSITLITSWHPTCLSMNRVYAPKCFPRHPTHVW
jgi:hypothetical protein